MDQVALTPPAAALTSRASWLTPVSLLLVNRLGVWLIAFLGLALLSGPPKMAGNAIPGNLFLDGWTRWDAQWYAHIARDGHTNSSLDASSQTDTGHFPLYPWTVRAVSWLTHDVYVAGILVSNISFVLAGLLLFRLIEAKFGTALARRTIILWSVWPFSYTFSAMYTESLFMLCVAAAFTAGESRRWWLASTFAALAGFTRLVGSVTGVAIAAMYLRAGNEREKWIDKNALWLPLGFAGVIGFAGLLWAWFGDPLLFIKVHAAAGWGDFNSFDELKRVFRLWVNTHFGQIASGNVPLVHTLHILSMALAAVLCIIGLWRLPIAWSVWLILTVAISYYRWGCFGRHFSTCWPAFVVAAMLLKSKPAYDTAIYLCVILLAVLTIMFTQGYWVA